MKKKKFRLLDAVLMSVVIVLGVESSAPASAVGMSQFFWWVFLLVTFFLPYGLISAELGTAYPDQGGLYDWVKKAFGRRWGGRIAWLYWINFPLWMASLAVLFPEILGQLLHVELSTFSSTFIGVVFIWIVSIVGCFPISESKWIVNVAALFKVIIMISLGFIGFYIAATKGVANEFSMDTLLPKFNTEGLTFLSIIIFAFMGFEVVTAVADDMPNPKKQIPRAIMIGGLFIAFFYLLAAFGIAVAIPTKELSISSGVMDSFTILIGKSNPYMIVVQIMILFTLMANLISWSLGINYVASHAAKHHDLPAIYKLETKKNQMPFGSGLMNGTVASILVILAPIIKLITNNSDIFWSFFGLNVVAFLASYIIMFPAFLKLRKIDPDRPRPFRVPGGPILLTSVSYIPMFLLIITLIFTIVPFNTTTEELMAKLPILVGSIIAIIIGEILVVTSSKKNN